MVALLSDAKISSLTLQRLLKYDELSWERRERKETAEWLLNERELEIVPSVGLADTLNLWQYHWTLEVS